MEWVESEYSTLDLADKRLNKRAKSLLSSLGASPNSSIPTTFKSWAETKAAYRFFDNDSVTAKKVIKPHRKATLERIKQHSVVLLIEDTTTLNYSGQTQREDLGPIQQDNVRGIFVHPMLAITPNRECLGVVSYEQWYRDDLSETTSRERRLKRYSKPINEKESYRWVKGYKKANKIAKTIPDTKCVYIADREGDIYDIYHEAEQHFDKHSSSWIIRANYNRKVLNSSEKLKETVNFETSLGQVSFVMSPARNRKKREVTQDIYVKKVTLVPPTKKGKTKLSAVEITVIISKELNPPKGEKPVEWVLLTSMPISNLKDALYVIELYLCRWQIEIFFKILKSGCNIEKLQLNSKNTFDPCLALYLIISWRILYLTMMGRSSPSLSSDVIFEAVEWQTAYVMIYKKPPPSEPPPLEKAVRWIAQLGGFIGRKSDGYPGAKVMWQGLQALYQCINAREAFESAYAGTYG